MPGRDAGEPRVTGREALVPYATVEGQSGKIAASVAERLTRAGWATRLLDAASDQVGGLDRFDAAILVAPLHAGHYPEAIAAFTARHRDALGRVPSAFISVSLSAAGEDPGDRAGLQRCVDAFATRTGWRPDVLHHAAGAFRFTRYSLLKRWALKYIAWRRGQPTDTGRDHELTDWRRLGEFVDRFAAEALAQARAPRP